MAFAVAAVAGAVAFVAALLTVPGLAVGIGANTLFAVYLVLVFIELPRMTPEFLKEHADREDAPAWMIMGAIIGIVGVSVFSLFAALNGGENPDPAHVTAGMVSVILGWFVVHTMAALHYAYEFYESPSSAPGGKRDGTGKGNNVGGFLWPEGDEPDGVAFFYIAYQVGSAVQISDVPANSNRMRALVVAHSTFSFFYNTLLLAAAVNVVLKLAGG